MKKLHNSSSTGECNQKRTAKDWTKNTNCNKNSAAEQEACQPAHLRQTTCFLGSVAVMINHTQSERSGTKLFHRSLIIFLLLLLYFAPSSRRIVGILSNRSCCKYNHSTSLKLRKLRWIHNQTWWSVLSCREDRQLQPFRPDVWMKQWICSLFTFLRNESAINWSIISFPKRCINV